MIDELDYENKLLFPLLDCQLSDNIMAINIYLFDFNLFDENFGHN